MIYINPTGWKRYFYYQFDQFLIRSGIEGFISNILDKTGIDKFHLLTIAFIVISLFTLNDLKNWNKLSFYWKFRDVEGWTIAAICLIASIIMVLRNLFN